MNQGFRILNISGKSIPTHESIMAILAESPSYEDSLVAMKLSNEWFGDMIHKNKPEEFIPRASGWMLEVLKFHQQLNDIEFKQFETCEIAQADYEKYMQSKAIVSWHESIRGNHQGLGAQDFRKDIGVTIRHLNGKESIEYRQKTKAFLEFPEKGTGTHFSMNEELRQACDIVSKSNATFQSLLGSNSQLLNLYFQELELRKKSCLLVESLSHPGSYEYRCPYCSKYSPQQSKKIPAFCSDQCQKDYKRNWEEESRNYRPKNTRHKAGWKAAFNGTRKMCEGAFCAPDGGRLL
jgi:endogenous inhibitor of DNA gyrase (YacG/DUF329 family)